MISVSIIEDDKHYREGLETLIGNSPDFVVLHSYPSAEIALPHIVTHPPRIAVVDIKLPGRNGIDLIGAIKKASPDIQCMVCSFYDDDEYVFNALKNGACGYILKDSMPNDILISLKELHEGGAPMSRYIARKVINTFQAEPAQPRLTELTDRENEILQLIATGMIVKEISTRLFLSAHTVTKHLKNIYTKLHVNNRIEAVNRLKQ
ncbi:MAG TPA: response regulator transcription factor [Chitinophagaceae bacterium]|nr:response regulator transcription factor [Chitinophagaceae bacterium]